MRKTCAVLVKKLTKSVLKNLQISPVSTPAAQSSVFLTELWHLLTTTFTHQSSSFTQPENTNSSQLNSTPSTFSTLSLTTNKLNKGFIL